VLLCIFFQIATADEKLTPSDKQGAWEMYVELTTKDATPGLDTARLGIVGTDIWENARCFFVYFFKFINVCIQCRL
jgi:hypothetical protein